MQTAPSMGGLFAGGLFFIIWLLMMGTMLIGWVLVLVAIWRAMRAHESIADSLEKIAER